MNWVSEIFKDITVSKTLTGACFITGISLLFAPTLFPDTLEAIPKNCSGQLKLATVLEFSQYNRSDSLGVKPPLY